MHEMLPIRRKSFYAQNGMEFTSHIKPLRVAFFDNGNYEGSWPIGSINGNNKPAVKRGNFHVNPMVEMDILTDKFISAVHQL